MASYGHSDKQADKKIVGACAPVPPPYGYQTGAFPAGYPTMASAPQMQSAYPGYPAAGLHYPPQGPPPPYSVAVSQPATVTGYPGYVSVGYPYGIPVYSQPVMAHPGSTVVMPGGYDTGARFDGIARPSVPPPPPGVAPNAAQMAMMQPGSAGVVLTQQKGSFLMGGSDGGYTFW